MLSCSRYGKLAFSHFSIMYEFLTNEINYFFMLLIQLIKCIVLYCSFQQELKDKFFEYLHTFIEMMPKRTGWKALLVWGFFSQSYSSPFDQVLSTAILNKFILCNQSRLVLKARSYLRWRLLVVFSQGYFPYAVSPWAKLIVGYIIPHQLK